LIRLAARSGSLAGQTFSWAKDIVTIGRADGNDLVLTDEVVSGDHARVIVDAEGAMLMDNRSTNGTHIVRGGALLVLGDAEGRAMRLAPGDRILLGPPGRAVELDIEVQDDATTTHVLALKKIADVSPVLIESDQKRLTMLYTAQKQMDGAQDLNEVLRAVADAALHLVSGATHATIALREEDEDGKAQLATYVPVLTRTRDPALQSGTIPVSRSVIRKVVQERAVVIAADASMEVGQTESILGAQIRSTMGVPLWRNEEITGVLQLDNRTSQGMFNGADLDVMAVLAGNASLAVSNARLVERLRIAEERLRKENTYLKGKERERRIGSKSPVPEIIGTSNEILNLVRQLDKVVDTRVTVLIEGETGVGKELIAASVHYRSKRREKMFIGQNCAALPENLLESELFGHKRGAFTGAVEEKKGLFEIADGGTLFLDEVTEMPLSLQTKLLRALQEGTIRPIGANLEKKVDVRIVAATNRNLETEVAEGRFREDLYYRLKVFPLRVPPLRERRVDIPMLANHFLKRFAVEMGKSTAGFSQQAMEILQSYDFPGNVRELQNEVQRLLIQVEPDGFVAPEMLSARVRQVEGTLGRIRPEKGTLKEMMDQIERFLLIESLREHQNNKTASAKSLGITREGLHKKLRQFGL
jgi:transcriptional regulator with GAF, ATPase, and Fis domain